MQYRKLRVSLGLTHGCLHVAVVRGKGALKGTHWSGGSEILHLCSAAVEAVPNAVIGAGAHVQSSREVWGEHLHSPVPCDLPDATCAVYSTWRLRSWTALERRGSVFHTSTTENIYPPHCSKVVWIN